MKKQILLFVFILFAKNYFAQDWMGNLQGKNANFYQLQASFKEYFKDRDITAKGKGYKQFKRWEYMTEQRVYPSGNLSLLSTTWSNYEEFLKKNSASQQKYYGNNQITSTSWTPMGPFGPLSGLAENNLPRKAGRYNYITFNPSNPNIFWVGAPSGGLWKTTNNGATWSTNTDNLPIIGSTDMAIDPTNPNIMYMSTGDGYSSHYGTYSVGVLKSIDGGVTWNTTGLTFLPGQKEFLRHIIVSPFNPQIVLVATQSGIYRSKDAGTTWSHVTFLNTFDLEFKPGDPGKIYASTLSFWVSSDTGKTFVQTSSGIPTNGGRTEIAVTAANPNYVYVLKAGLNDLLQGVYQSTNSGASFTTKFSAPNILSADCITPQADGQGSYDLTIAASPLNANEITIGGINIWQSQNSGTSFTNIGCAYGTGNPPFIHADHHEVEYTPNGTLYSANDGGVYEYTGTQWNDISSPANIAMLYRIGTSSLSPALWITGHQDNGSNIYNSGIYNASLSGDGMDCFIDRTNDKNIFASRYNGTLMNSMDGGIVWNSVSTGSTSQSAWVTPWKQDPQTASTFWLGRDSMYRSTTSGGIFWQPRATLPGSIQGEMVTEFAIAPSNNQYLYVLHGNTGVYTSTNAGTSFVQSNSGLAGAIANAKASNVIVHPTNSSIAWVTFSGYYAGNKVFKTINGGTSWTNVSYNLPNISANCLVYEPGNSNDRIYVGMDVGVYYIDNTTNTWTLYNTGLPNVIVSDLEISPAAPTKIRAATFGRGVYQVDIVPNNAAPVCAFNYMGNICTLPSSIVMNDNSTNSPNAWSWTVLPAAGVTLNSSSIQTPTITFTNPGTYSISLTATNSFGTGAASVQTITIGSPTLSLSSTAQTICTGQTVTLTVSGATTYTWQPGNKIGSTATYTPAATKIYTVSATGMNGCVSKDTISVAVSPCTGVIQSANTFTRFSIFPNPANDKLNIFIGVDKPTEILLELTDVSGKLALSQNTLFINDKNPQQLNISMLAKGVYVLKITSKEIGSQAIKIIKE
jgi:photosystem II stability/assembly factor-like uncharacterized protein/PKD repeat protein